MATRELRELLTCIEAGELNHCSMGDHATHDETKRGAEAVSAGWAALRALDKLLDAADVLVALHYAEPGAVSAGTVTEAVDRLAAEVANRRNEAESVPRYPEVTVQLLGESNSYLFMARVGLALRRADVSQQEVGKFTDEAMRGDHDHLIQTAKRWVVVE